MSTHKTLQALWEKRERLESTPDLIETLTTVRANHLPGSGIARQLEIYLKDEKPHYHHVEGLSSVESVRLQKKKILILALSYEHPSVHEAVAEHIQHSVEPIDVFLHYPVTKNVQAREMVSDSYAAKKIYHLDTERSFQEFGDQVRFHYCDLRLEWMGNKPELLLQRLKLLGDYSEYLFHQEEKQAEDLFSRELRYNSIEFDDILELDKALILLEGKVRKSYQEVYSRVREEVLYNFQDKSTTCRLHLEQIKEEMLAHAVIPIKLYISLIGEVNCLYQYVNAMYTLLRIFRRFKEIPERHSAEANNCIVILPEPVIQIMKSLLPSLSGKTGGLALLEEWFRS